jgi:Cu2+-containing amine oxidase
MKQEVLRPILARVALSEMIVPYGYPHAPHFRKNAVIIGFLFLFLMNLSLIRTHY